MRYFALYQRQFLGLPQELRKDSHVLVGETYLRTQGDVYQRFQAEQMGYLMHRQIAKVPVQHTSMSVGDVIIDETGDAVMVMPVGFAPLEVKGLEARTELAWHLLALGLARTPGWRALFVDEREALVGALVERLKDNHPSVRERLAS